MDQRATFSLDAVPCVREHEPLAQHTTMRVGGPARTYVEVDTPEQLAACVARLDKEKTPVLVLGGGSNTVVCDEGLAGTVVRLCNDAIDLVEDGDDVCALVRVSAGAVWDDFACWCVAQNLAGVEALSGIPGCIGSAVMQNLGAYGQEIGTHLACVELFDRADCSLRTYQANELALGYRSSMLRTSLEEALSQGGPWYPTPRWVVLSATFRLERAGEGLVGNAQLARALGCEEGARMPLADIRAAVLDVRAGKGMVADPDPCGPNPQYDRWSSGSFFTNPVLTCADADRLLPPDAPRYATADPDRVKTSAAWLIERAGFSKGYGVHGEASRATLSTLHTLALTNRGQATAADVAELARTVRDGVRAQFGVELVPESVLVGIEL